MAAALARRTGGALSALLLLLLLYAAWSIAAPLPWVRLVIVLPVVLAALQPRHALLVLAGLGPVIGALGGFFGAPFPLREALVLATLTGWSLRVGLVRFRTPLLPADLSWPVICATTVVLASMAVEMSGQWALLGPAAFRETVVYTLQHGLLLDRHGVRGLESGVIYLEGLGVFAATVAACTARRAFAVQVARMAVIGGAGAAALNLQRIGVAALASASPLERLRELLATVRVSIQYPDVNAAGSYFALMFFPAGALALHAGALWRVLWLTLAVVIFAAAWLTGSRAAVASILVVSLLSTLAGVYTGRRGVIRTVAALVLILVLAAAFIALFPNRVIGAATPIAVQIRLEMARVSLDLLAQHPFFGVGVGGFYEASGPLLAGSHFYPRENAHNNALQILAELGVAGFAAFTWLLWRAGRRIVTAAGFGDAPAIGGAAAGLVAFGLTAMLGHPLLTPEVSHVFWLVLGLACGSVPLPGSEPAVRSARKAGTLLAALVLAFLPWRFRAESATLDLEHIRYGVSRWAVDEEGMRYQTFTDRVTLFAPTSARAVDIPLRLEDGSAPVAMEIRFRNRVADRVIVTSSGWHTYRLVIPAGRNDPPYVPVQIRVSDGTGVTARLGRTVPR